MLKDRAKIFQRITTLTTIFFALYLDDTMTYSSAYFKHGGMTLKEAQFAKYERLCEQLNLQKNRSGA